MAELRNIPGAPPAPLLTDRLNAARLLGISPTTLDTLRLTGQIPSLKIGTRRLFALADLQTFVATRKGVGQ